MKMVKQQSELHGNMERAAEMTVPLGEKRCQRCGITKTLDNFTKKKAYSDGLDPWCKQCKREYKRKWYVENYDHAKAYKEQYNIENREKNIEYSRRYRELNPEKVRELDRARKASGKWKQQNSKYHAKNYVKNREKLILQVKKYQSENPDKVRFYKRKNKQIRRSITDSVGNDFTSIEWIECQLYFNYSCAYCGVEPKILEQDHVLAVTKGGGFTKTNIVPACRSCNNSKKDKDMEKWYKGTKHFNPDRLEAINQYISQW